ncbi:uncharacterized protein [Asterias amurensis]|uniref:uncharacterized protein n=1 Tax=Asterias amurensis TaxID=7602 RepID=UPI003AB5BB26
MNEPGDVDVKWPLPEPQGINVEPQEMDPEIKTMYDVSMEAGEQRTFEVAYKTFKGPATISLRNAANKPYKEFNRTRNGILKFTIPKATTAHSGVYTVEILDERRRKAASQNPVRTSFTVTVNKPQCDCSIV